MKIFTALIIASVIALSGCSGSDNASGEFQGIDASADTPTENIPPSQPESGTATPTTTSTPTYAPTPTLAPTFTLTPTPTPSDPPTVDDTTVPASFSSLESWLEYRVRFGEFCGFVAYGDSQLNSNTCVTQALADGRSFYAIYQTDGIDSAEATAIFKRDNNELKIVSFTNERDGRIGAGDIALDYCLSASLSGVVNNDYNELFNCSDRLSQMDYELGRLAQNRQKWEQSAIENYEFRLTVDQWGYLPTLEDYVLTVNAGLLSNTYSLISNEEVVNPNSKVRTIDGYFDFIEQAINSDPDWIAISYDSDFGFPVGVFGDNDVFFWDDEYSFGISEFELEGS